MKKVLSVILSAVLVLSLAACSSWNVEVKDPEESSSAPESVSSAPENPEIPLPELSEFNTVAFDRDGLGDNGWQYPMYEEQQAEFLELLQPESWYIAENLPAMGVDGLTVINSGNTESIHVGTFEEKTLILVSTEDDVYFAPIEVYEDAKAFFRPFEEKNENDKADLTNTPEANTAPLTFEIPVTGGEETRSVTITFPDWWNAEGTSVYEDGRLVAEFHAYPEAEIEALTARFEEPSEEFTSGEVSGVFYRFQEEITEGGMTGFNNIIYYYIGIGDDVTLEIAFHPAFGIGIYTQREEFQGYLSSLRV